MTNSSVFEKDRNNNGPILQMAASSGVN